MLGTSNSYVASTLRKDFQVIFCKLRTQHPSWLYKCKLSRINKVEGQLSFPQKTKVTLGGYNRGHPPRKNGPIFS
jgi:hypothetical protein